MNNADYAKLSRRQLTEQMERERREWRTAGMSEADIYRVHFGNPDENGRGGDYRAWLDERKCCRADHKYAPGAPVAIDTIDPNGVLLGGGQGGIDEVDFNIDLENALKTLTEWQAYCFTEVCINERSYTEVAKQCGRHHSSIQEAVKAAKAKLKKILY